MFKTEAQRSQQRALEQSLARQRAEREEREREEKAAQDERDRSNAATRKAYLDGLEAKRADERRRAEARVDAQLADEKTRTGREWLANHPDKTPADFEATWTRFLRPNAVQELERLKGEATRASLLSTGKYSPF
jgi:hypothetical protein